MVKGGQRPPDADEGKGVDIPPDSHVARTLGRSENAVKDRFKYLASINERLREQSEDTSGKYIIKMTDFDTSIVVTYMEVDIKFFGNSAKAWNYTMGVIRAENLKARSNGLKQFYWVRYK